MLLVVFQVVFELVGCKDHGFRWVWAAGARVTAELASVKQGTPLHEAKKEKRQSSVVVKSVRQLFFNTDMVTYLKSMNISDNFLRVVAKQNYRGDDEYVIDTFRFLQNARTTGQTPGVRAWVEDLLGPGTSVPSHIQAVNINRDWIPVMHEVLSLFPMQCSLCNSQWNMSKTWQSIFQLVASNTKPRGVSFLTAVAAAASSASSSAAGGVSLLTAADARGARTAAVPKRPPWADAEDQSGPPEEKRAKKKSDKKVSFQEEPAAPEPRGSPDASYYFVILDCDLSEKVLLRSYGRELEVADTTDFLVAIASQKRSFGMLEQTDAEDLASFTNTLVENCAGLRQELSDLEATVHRCDFYPPLDTQGWSPLRRVQFLLFLHVWSVVTQEYGFFVSSALLRLVGIPLRTEKTYDLFDVVHKYCYVIWLHRTDAPTQWSAEALSFLLPGTREWNAWWAQEQISANGISELAFSEEYLLMVADPLGDRADELVKNELGDLKRRLRRSDLVIAPQIPKHYTWHEHDVYIDAEDALPIPRALPCIRCTAGLQETAWGDESGMPLGVTRQNLVQETDCCLVVKVPVPDAMTLDDVLSTRDWTQSFENCRLGRPYWSTAAAGGSSAPVTALMTQIHLHALGAEIMATLRPDNVMHPHLRSHFEFLLGVFASVHLATGDARQVRFSDFLLGCGLQVKVTARGEASWVAAAYGQRHADAGSVVRPMCHTLWGEKTRPIGFPHDDPEEPPFLYLVHDACPLFLQCENHKQVTGFGTVCPHWHGFSKKHGKACTLAAQRYLKFKNIGDKGKSTRDKDSVGQYFRSFLETIGMLAPANTTAEDADDRLLLVGLPRWLPEFHNNTGPDAHNLIPFNSQTSERHFFEGDRRDCLKLRTHATNLQDEVVKAFGQTM
jgi:hypothetical protein